MPKRQQTRYNPDSFYQSNLWKSTRSAFLQGSTPSPKGLIPNTLCYDCFLLGKRTLMHTVDHHLAIKAGGSRVDHANLRSLCQHHHAIKSANEGKTWKS